MNESGPASTSEVAMESDTDKKIKELEAKLNELKARLPSAKDRKTGLHTHPDPVNMLIEIEETEEELQRLRSANHG